MRGTIQTFLGSWSSGIATLVIKDDEEHIHSIPCDNAPTVRALADQFPNVITPGHCVNLEAIKGKEIEYGLDTLGILAWLCAD